MKKKFIIIYTKDNVRGLAHYNTIRGAINFIKKYNITSYKVFRNATAFHSVEQKEYLVNL